MHRFLASRWNITGNWVGSWIEAQIFMGHDKESKHEYSFTLMRQIFLVKDIDIEAMRLDIYLKIVSFTFPQTGRMSQQKLSFSYNSHTRFSTRSKFHGQVAWFWWLRLSERGLKRLRRMGRVTDKQTVQFCGREIRISAHQPPPAGHS